MEKILSYLFLNLKISGFFHPAVVRLILDSFETSKQVPQPALSDVSIKFCEMFI